jgi:MFS family permease
MTPGAVAAAVVGAAAGRSGRAIPPRVLVVAGALLLAATTAALALWLPAEPHYVTAWLLPSLALGAGVGAASVGVTSAAALSVAPARFAAATGLNIAARQVGGAVGVAVLAAVLDGAHGPGPFLTVYWIVAAASLGAALAGLALGPRVSVRRPGIPRAWPPRITVPR